MNLSLSNMLSSNASGFDPDAKSYIDAVEAADAQSLESGVKTAINNFIRGLKEDGEWGAIEFLRCYAGPRTLAGCAVPIKGAAPTLVNFVSGDINRKTGLIASSGKYVDHNNGTLTQNSAQVWVWATLVVSQLVASHVFGNTITGAGGTTIRADTLFQNARLNNTGTQSAAYTSFPVAGLIGVNRNNSSTYVYRSGGISETLSVNSAAPFAADIYSFGLNNAGALARGMLNRHALEGIGTSWTNPAQIESRITTYLAAINTVI